MPMTVRAEQDQDDRGDEADGEAGDGAGGVEAFPEDREAG